MIINKFKDYSYKFNLDFTKFNKLIKTLFELILVF